MAEQPNGERLASVDLTAAEGAAERKQADAVREESDTRTLEPLAELEHLYTNTPIGLGLVDTHLRYVRVNERLAALNGRGIADHLGRSLHEVVPEVAPRIEPLYRRVIETGEPALNIEIRGTTPADPNVERDFLVSYFPLKSEQGVVRGVSIVVQDITQRKQAEAALAESRDSERRFRELLAALHDVTLELATAPSFDDLCRRAVELGRTRLGFERLGLWFCTGEPRVAHGSFGTDEHGQIRDERGARVVVYPNSAFGKLLSGKEPAVLLEEVPLYSHDDVVGRGTQAVAALWNGQEAIGYLSTDNLLHGRPITERHCELLTLYAATIGHLCTRQRTEEALQAADRRKDEFLAMLAHELRNPLAAIQNAVYLIRRRGADETAVPRASEVVERQVRHLARLVDDLLDVSRITHNKIELRKQVVELATVVMEAIEASRPFIETRQHELSVSLSPEPVWLEADPTRLEQVLINLLNNAAKFTAVGGHIGLTVERGGNEVLLRVRDTGIGIPPELLPQVFDLFTQADLSLDRPQGGLGIGLTLVRRLVEMHGGSVRAESAGTGQGSQFVVRLPALPHDPPAATRPVPRTGHLPHPSRRVLVVEDNLDMAETLAELLDLWGYEVRVVYNGHSAMEEASRYQPQVVLLDIGLPGVNGYEVARWLREQALLKEILLVAVTGYGQEEDRRQAEAAGFDHYLTKPVDPSALERVLAAASGGSLSRRGEPHRRGHGQR